MRNKTNNQIPGAGEQFAQSPHRTGSGIIIEEVGCEKTFFGNSARENEKITVRPVVVTGHDSLERIF